MAEASPVAMTHSGAEVISLAAELEDQTVGEAWKAGEYGAVIRLVESLPDKNDSSKGFYIDE